MMNLPFVYTLESLRARWRSATVAVLGIAGSVGVFVAMLALAVGFQSALATSGSPGNALVRRAGASSEMDSVLTLEQVRAIEDQTTVAHGATGPLVSPEVVSIAALPLRISGVDANVQVRGVTPRAFELHDRVRVIQGQLLRPGLADMLVGKHAAQSYSGLDVGAKLSLGGREWEIVGIFDSGGSSFDSEVWCDADLLSTAYQRPQGIFQTAVVRLTSPDQLKPLAEALKNDPRFNVQVESQAEYYAKASQMLTGLILGLGSLVAGVMGVGAIFGALNTMYSAVSERTREIGTIRALGFKPSAIVLCFGSEALLIAALGGLVGCVAALPLNGLTTSTLNFQTFSHISFAFRVTPELLGYGFGFALLMGLLGGLPPAIRASRLPVTVALREG